MLNMLPKFELAVILMYLRILPNTLRPSSTPSSSTSRLFSSRMMSADSLAMSTAVSTEMPTSAARKAGPSLMPSPRNPTTCLSRCKAWITRTFCCGLRRAKTGVSRVAMVSCSSLIASIFGPVRYLSTCIPTCRHTLRVTMSLSPVRIFTATPFALSARIASAALSLGGSRKAMKPIIVKSFSSSREYARLDFDLAHAERERAEAVVVHLARDRAHFVKALRRQRLVVIANARDWNRPSRSRPPRPWRSANACRPCRARSPTCADG